jgi:Ser/Thr protein kinase RdoA (MazF antagonist)
VSGRAAPARYAPVRRAAELAVTARNATRLLAGARMADAQALESLSAEAEASLEHARSEHGLPSSWALGERLTTVADVAVVEVRDGGDLAAVLKLARSPAGGTSLRLQQETLQQLAADPRLVRWRRYLPEVLAHGDVADRAYSVEKAVPGTVGTSLPDAADPTQATVDAVRTIAGLHRATGRATTATAALVDRWLEPALSLVADVPMLLGPTRRHRLVGLLRDVIRAGLEGRTVWLSRTHGDYFPGNVFFGPSSAVTGVIDWGQSREDDPALIDPMTLVLDERARTSRQGLGGAVRDLCRDASLSDREAALLETHRVACPADPVDVDVMGLLAWLRHVENNLLKSPRYGAHPVWVRTNLEVVLKAVGGRAA